MKTVLCYGDSNTYGYNPSLGRGSRYPKDLRWPTILQLLLGSEFEVIAEGLNGRTTAYNVPEYPWKNGEAHLAPIMGSHKPLDYLIFMLGTNDCNVAMNLSSYDISVGMDKLIKTAKKVAMIQQESIPEIVVIAPAPISDDISDSPFYGEINICSVKKSREICDLYRDVAINNDCLFVDANSIEVSDLDAEHLTENGHRQLAELIYKEIFENDK